MFDNDAKDHLVDSSISGYGWTEDMPMYGWIVGDVGRYSTKSDDDDYDDDEFYHVATRRFRSLFEVTPAGGDGGNDDDDDDDVPVVLITGASGMLGRALHR